MEKLSDHEFYKFNPNSLYDIRKLYNLEKPGAMSDAIDILEEWLKKQAHFLKKDFDRGYLERTIIRAKGSIEKSKQRLDKLCTSRTSLPMFFVNKKTNEFEDLEILEDTMLPQPTTDNYRIYLLRNVGKEFTDNFILNYYKRIIHVLEHLYAEDYVIGHVVVLDYRECSLLNLLKCFDAGVFHNILSIILNGYGSRVKAIHMVSPSKAIETFVALLKQLISAKLGSRIHVHKTIESVHKHVDKALFPVDYGGTQKSLSELHKQHMDLLSREDVQDYLKMMNAAGTDESYRPTDKFNDQCLGLPGTFRSLMVD